MALIDREKLLEFAHNHIGGVIDCNDIARFPTVDAEPVRRGKWVQDQDGYTYCSRCEKYIPTVHRYRDGQDGDLYEWDEEIEKTDYCPNCGAKMEEEEESDPKRKA